MSALWVPLAYAAACALIFVPLEALFGDEQDTRPGRFTDIGFATIGGVLSHLLVVGVAGALLALAASLPAGPLARVPAFPRMGIALLVFELAGYAYHRIAHVLPGLRELHDVHHSAPGMDWLAGFRQHPIEVALMTLAQNLPLVLLGVPLGAHALLATLLRVNTLFLHSNLRVPAWVGLFVATPRFHHRHHARTGPVANYATLFPWLDRLFGTYDAGSATRFGLPGLDDAGFGELLVLRARGETPPRR